MFDLSQCYKLSPARRAFLLGTTNQEFSQVLGTYILTEIYNTTSQQKCALAAEAIVSPAGEACLLSTFIL
jgi:hypothetical protein